jgi:RND family efflux transporter MFP subunit
MTLIIAVMITGCTSASQEIIVKEKPVEVETLEIMTNPEELYYFGIVQPKSIKQLAFSQGGTLNEVFVGKGDYVERGELLAAIDPENYDIALDTSNQQVRVAQLDYGKARKSFEYYEELYNDSLNLYEAGAVSKMQLDEIELGYEVAKRELSQAESLYNQAKLGANYSENQLSDTQLTADTSGYIVDVLNEEGEIIGPGYPVILLRDKEQIVQVGLSAKDIKKVNQGMKAIVKIDDIEYEGEVTRVYAMPDSRTRTYLVEISIITEDVLLLGDMAKVFITIKDIEGIWLYVSNILNDGEDYVYIVEDSRAVRKNIEIHDLYNEFVRVEGLNSGDRIITSGMHSVHDGYLVNVLGDQDE